MPFQNHNRTALLPGTPPTLPPQDQALSWAYSVCFHTLALAVAAVATVPLRNVPQAPAPVYRMEFILSDPNNRAGQVASSDPQGAADPVPLQEAADPTKDLSPSPSMHSTFSEMMEHAAVDAPPTVQRTRRRATPASRMQEPTDVSSTAHDPVSTTSPMPIEQQSETTTPIAESYQPASPFPSEPVKHSAMSAATQATVPPAAETSANTSHDYAEPSSHVPPEPSPNPVEAIANVTPVSAIVPMSTHNGDSSSPPTDPAAAIDSQTGVTGSPLASSTEAVAVNHPAVTQSVSARSQYAWLMDLLRRRIISLQAYPGQARMQGWEGVVVVKTTINSDGNLLDAVVTKSSGYGALDEDALTLMRRVCPLHLPQDLGKSQIAILIPIHYKLDRFE